MDRKEIYEKIKDRKVYNTSRDLEIQLFIVLPDGAKAHKLANLRQFFNSTARLYRDDYLPKDETLSECRERDKSDFESFIRRISESINYFNVKI